MSKKMLFSCLVLMSSSALAQNAEQTQAQPQSDMSAPSASSEGRVWDEGQVQVSGEGQVENMPEGQVEAINPVGEQLPVQNTQPDLFRFESRLFNPIPSDQ